MAEPTLLSIAAADLRVAERLVDSENKYEKHCSAYHTQQAVEKTIKFIIASRTGVQPWGHDIGKLINKAERSGIRVPKEIADRASAITSWEAEARYFPVKVIRRDVIKRVIDATKRWHTYIRKVGVDKV